METNIWNFDDKKIGPDRFSRFDVYWLQTINTKTDKPNLYIDYIVHFLLV